MSSEEQAVAVYEYCRLHTYHWPAPREIRSGLYETDVVYDALKLLNVYGYSYCFAIRALAEALYEAAGFEARSKGLGGHAVAEVYYDGAYHMLDHDQRGYARLADGPIASVEDYENGGARKLLSGEAETSVPLFPATRRPLVPYEERHISAGYFLNRGNHWSQHNKYRTTHSMNINLRPGERLTRSWEAAGKWHLPDGLVEEIDGNGYVDLSCGPFEHVAELYDEAPTLDDGGPLRYANGVLVYRPDLTNDVATSLESLSLCRNIAKMGPGLRADDCAHPAAAEYRVRLPYVIVGDPGDLDGESTGACIVSGSWFRQTSAAKLCIKVSSDHSPWRTVMEAAGGSTGECAIDVSRSVAGRYSFTIRFEIEAEGSDAGFWSIGVDTSFQCNPAVQPAVRLGNNQMTVSFKPGAEVFEEDITYRDVAKHNDLCVSCEDVQIEAGAYPTLRPIACGATGSITYTMAAPAGKEIAWARVGGAFRSHQDVAAAPDEGYRILFAEQTPDEWKLAWEADRPSYLDHWCFEANVELPIRKGVRTIYLRYELTRSEKEADGGGIVMARYAWGCDPISAKDRPVRVVHAWQGDQGVCTLARSVTHSGESYEFTAAGNAVRNLWYTVELDGCGPAADGKDQATARQSRDHGTPGGPQFSPSTSAGASPARSARERTAAVIETREALGQLDAEPKASLAAAVMKNHSSQWMRNAAPAALLAIGGDEALEALRQEAATNQSAATCYVELLGIDGSTKDLIVYLGKSEGEARRRVAELLEYRRDATAGEALSRALHDEGDPKTKAALAAALVAVAGRATKEPALDAMSSLEGTTRLRIAGALATCGDSVGFETLIRALGGENRYERETAARELAESGRADALPGLRKALRDTSHWVRRQSIAGLARLGATADVGFFESARSVEPRIDLQREIDWAITSIQKRQTRP